MPLSQRAMKPSSSISLKFSLLREICGQIETISSMPIAFSSLTIALGSGQNSSSKRKSPMCGQWKKSTTITSTGMPRLWYSRATESSCSWFQ